MTANEGVCKMRPAVTFLVFKGWVCTMRPAVTFRVFKRCAKCGLRLRSVCLRGVQNPVCGYVRCVSFTSRCPAPSVLCILTSVSASKEGRNREHKFVVCQMQRYRPAAWFACHPRVSVLVTWRSSTPYSGLIPILTGRFALLPSGDEASNRKRCYTRPFCRRKNAKCAGCVAWLIGRRQSG